MEGEQGRDHSHGLVAGDGAGGVEQADLGGGVEPVARLDLDRGDPAAHQRMEAAARRGAQFVGAGGLGRGDGRGDPAPRLCDFLIGRAGAAHGMFLRARAAEDEVGVAVDEAGGDPGAAQGDDVAGTEAGELGALADPDDAAVDDADRGIGHDAERIARGGDHRRDVAVGKQAVPHGAGIGRARC